MGVSGFILKNRNEISLKKTVDDIIIVSQKAHLNYTENYINYTLFGKLKKAVMNIAENSHDEDRMSMLLYVHNMMKYQEEDHFDWILKKGNLYKIVIFDRYKHREKLLLDFLVTYMELNQKDFFYGGLDWYYDYNLIKEIERMPFSNNWCHIHPNKLLDLKKDYSKPSK